MYSVRTSNQALSKERKQLAGRLGISETFLRLLLGRGFKEEEIYDYLHPSLSKLSSPFEIRGMREAAERVKRAIAKGERILIYGDYDCDGICAISILMLYLKGKTDVGYFIPDRNKDGYGISIGAFERFLDKRPPSLVITVDCGITAAKEVDFLTSKGVDVIVTDHHEPQDELPKCVVVDAKIDKKGFYEFCGAGVALKLVEALGGRAEAEKYFDIAAIATIADVVPLVGDNRIIASMGLKRLASEPRKGIKMLLGEDATSQDIMFKLAPRMNAAGRLGSAMKVVGLFLESDYFMLKTLAEELIRDNARRQGMCEIAFEEAKAMLKGQDFNRLGIIILRGENWEPGILGIAAAKLVEEFKRPAILFARAGEELKGSARSVPAVNIFELLSKFSGRFLGFGGHAQAAGVSMAEDEFEAFRQEANEFVLSTLSAEDFDPAIECEMALPLDADFLSFAKELELMEPTGYQNARPTFLLELSGVKFNRIGFSKHVKLSLPGLDVVGFSRFADSLTCRLKKVELEVNLGVNVFQNNVTAQAVIRSASVPEPMLSQEDSALLNVHQLNYEGKACLKEATSVERLFEGNYGTLAVCFSQAEYDEFCRKCEVSLPLFVGNAPCLNPVNAVVLCPSEDMDFGYYKRVIVAGDALSEGYLKRIADSVPEAYSLGGKVTPLKISDDTLRAIYRELGAAARRPERGGNMHSLFVGVCSRYKVSEPVFSAAMKIFADLGLVSISQRGQLSVSKGHVRLEDSPTYRNLSH